MMNQLVIVCQSVRLMAAHVPNLLPPNFQDISMKVGTMTCFAPRVNAVTNGSDRTTVAASFLWAAFLNKVRITFTRNDC